MRNCRKRKRKISIPLLPNPREIASSNKRQAKAHIYHLKESGLFYSELSICLYSVDAPVNHIGLIHLLQTNKANDKPNIISVTFSFHDYFFPTDIEPYIISKYVLNTVLLLPLSPSLWLCTKRGFSLQCLSLPCCLRNLSPVPWALRCSICAKSAAFTEQSKVKPSRQTLLSSGLGTPTHRPHMNANHVAIEQELKAEDPVEAGCIRSICTFSSSFSSEISQTMLPLHSL